MRLKCKLFLKKVLKIYKVRVKIKLNKIQFEAKNIVHPFKIKLIVITKQPSSIYGINMNFCIWLADFCEKTRI